MVVFIIIPQNHAFVRSCFWDTKKFSTISPEDVQNCGKLCGLCGKPLFCYQNTLFFVHLYRNSLWKTFARLLFLQSFIKGIDFLQKIRYNGVIKRIKRISKLQKGEFARE